MKDAVIILCGGGPAPGMNSVSMSVAKTFLSKRDNATCKFNQKNRIFLNREAGMEHMLTRKAARI